MPILRAITNGDDEELRGKEVAIRDGKIAQCPGCTATEVPVVENKEFGLTFVGHHNMPPIVGTTVVPCDYSGEVLKYLPLQQLKEEGALQ
ncbi:MAG: hypothetical protein M0P64_01450 [Candidatus Pacebacteria bacterium]|jgi:hypothetical protein|nr:hypothetical protein [Candidatus Paceibacterota bacterium]